MKSIKRQEKPLYTNYFFFFSASSINCFCKGGAVWEYLRNSIENSPLPWVDARKEVAKPNNEFNEHSAVMLNSSVSFSVSMIMPPNLFTRATTPPWNSFGAVISTAIMGSKMTGFAFKNAWRNAPCVAKRNANQHYRCNKKQDPLR